MARASVPTLLSLDRWAAIMGINGAHFGTGADDAVMPVTNNPCNDLYWQYSWQAQDRVSREDIARAINAAEHDIANYIRYWPAPVWVAEEVKTFPRHHRPDVIHHGGLDTRGYAKSINTDFGYVIAGGQRTTTLLGTPTVVYSDADGDGVNETATITQATTLTNECEVKVYFRGTSGLPEWEIRPARSKSIVGGTFTATFWTWQLIDPDLWEALTTTAGPAGIDWTQAANLVTTVDVYREYNDTTATSMTFYWEPRTRALESLSNVMCQTCGGTGCAACTYVTQDGCLHVRNATAGVVVPQAATYDSDDAQWDADCWSECRDPDFVKLWYYAGKIDNRRFLDQSCDLLSDWWAQTIAYLATARIERPLCSCANVTSLAMYLREDLSFAGRDGSYLVPERLLDNPFGRRRGEVEAWQRIGKIAKKRMAVAVA